MTHVSELSTMVKSFATSNGADLVGIAPAEKLMEAPSGRRPTDLLPTAQAVIVLAMRQFDYPRLDFLADDIPAGVLEYSANFHALNTQLDVLAYKIGRFLWDNGFCGIPVAAAGPYNEKKLFGAISHKHAAVEAGLGHFGINNLIITQEYGPRVRLVSIVTDAPLNADRPQPVNLCSEMLDTCRLACVQACPVGAISQNGIIDNHRCHRYIDMVLSGIPKLRCGMCIRACPIGKRAPQGVAWRNV